MKLSSTQHAAKVGERGQVAIPKDIREKLGLANGTYVDVREKNGRIVLTPQAFIDREIAIALRQVKRGKVHGPFGSMKDLITNLDGKTKTGRKRK